MKIEKERRRFYLLLLMGYLERLLLQAFFTFSSKETKPSTILRIIPMSFKVFCTFCSPFYVFEDKPRALARLLIYNRLD